MPTASAVTRPVELTDAIVGEREVHIIVSPLTGFPDASFGAAKAWATCPITIVVESILTAIDAQVGAGAVMISDQFPTTPPIVARIDTLPAATPVTTPDDDTVAKIVLDDDHATGRPVITLPAASFAVAVASAV